MAVTDKTSRLIDRREGKRAAAVALAVGPHSCPGGSPRETNTSAARNRCINWSKCETTQGGETGAVRFVDAVCCSAGGRSWSPDHLLCAEC